LHGAGERYTITLSLSKRAFISVTKTRILRQAQDDGCVDSRNGIEMLQT